MADGPSVGTAFLRVLPDTSGLNARLGAYFTSSDWGKMGKAAGAALGVGIAAGGAVKALYEIGEMFDNVTDKIRTETGATGKELNRLKGDFKNVFGALPTDAESAGSAIAGLNQRLDLTGKPLRKLSKQMLELSRITGTDLDSNIQSVSRLFGDWSVKTREQEGTLDKLFRTSQATGIEISDLSDSMVQFGSPLRQLGLDFDFSAAMFARFEKEGVNVQTLMPGLRMALKNFSAPSEDLGKTFQQLGIDLKEGPSAALQGVFEQLEKAPTDLKANALAFQVFGARAGPDMAAAVREGRFELDDLMETIEGGKDTIRGAGRETMDFSEHWLKFKNNVLLELEPVATRVFNEVGDRMKDLTKIMSDDDLTNVEKFDKMADLAGDALKDLIDKAADIGPKVAGAFLKAFASAWWDADILGKLFTAAVFVRLIGGKGVLAKIGVALGKKIGLAMGPVLAAEGAAATTAGSAAGGWKTAGTKIGKLMGPWIAAGIGGAVLLWLIENREDIKDFATGAKTFDEYLADQYGFDEADIARYGKIADRRPDLTQEQIAAKVPKLDKLNWEKTLGLKDFEKTSKQIGGGHRDLWGDITRQTGRGSDDTEDRTRTNHQRVRDGFEDTRRKLGDTTRKQTKDVSGNVGRMVNLVGEGFQTFLDNANNVLQGFDGKRIGFSIAKVGKTLGNLGFKSGGMIPGSGNTDSVPTMLTPGEGVITKTAVGKWGGPAFIDFINTHAQHLAGGGMVTGDTDYLPALGQALMSMSASTGRSISVQSGGRTMAEQQALYARYLAGGNLAAVPNANAPHVRGIAADITPGREVFASVAGKFGLGFPVSSESWHVELMNAAAAGKMGITAQKVARLLLKGPDGPLKSMGQGALDKARSAANSFIASQMPTVSAGFGGISTKGLGAGPAANRELGRKMMLTMFGADQWPFLDHLWGTDEGRWDENLANLAGSGAYGIAQALPSSKYPAAGQPGASPGIEKARAQIGWGLNYIDERYGNPAAADAFRHRVGWYAKGGLVEKFAAQIPQLHDGGIFRSKRPGGEGLAVLKDREVVTPEGQERPINVVNNVYVDPVSLDARIETTIDDKMPEIAEFTLHEGGRNLSRARQLSGRAGR